MQFCRIKLSILLLAACGVLSVSCADRAIEDPRGDQSNYPSTGVVVGIDRAAKEVTIDHEDIPGYMSAMEMTFTAADRTILDKIDVGDKVDFELKRLGDKMVVASIKKTGQVESQGGSELYATNCARCHGDAGQGAEKGIPLTSGHAVMHSRDEYIEQVLNGTEEKMPPFREKLSREQIEMVVNYVREKIQADVSDEQRKHHH